MKQTMRFPLVFCMLMFLTAAPFWAGEELPAKEANDSPFLLQPVPDAIFLAGSALFYGTTILYRHLAPFPEYTGEMYDKSAVNAVDRIAMQPYSYTFDVGGTIFCALSMALLPAGIFAYEYGTKQLPIKEVFTAGVMYAEAVLFASGVKDVIKLSVKRLRPYMYFEEKDAEGLTSGDYMLSFPSGHTTYAFLGASFVSYTFCSYFPESKWKLPLVVASYTLAGATGALRMCSGNHFFTDVVGGAVLGSIIGLGVPFLHTVFAKRQNRALELSLISAEGVGLFAKISL